MEDEYGDLRAKKAKKIPEKTTKKKNKRERGDS